MLLAVAATWPGQQAFGWGATGHEWATGIAIEKLPVDVPAFVRDLAMLLTSTRARICGIEIEETALLLTFLRTARRSTSSPIYRWVSAR